MFVKSSVYRCRSAQWCLTGTCQSGECSQQFRLDQLRGDACILVNNGYSINQCVFFSRSEVNQTCEHQSSSNLLCNLSDHQVVRKDVAHPHIWTGIMWLCSVWLWCETLSSAFIFCRNFFWLGWSCFHSVFDSLCAVLLHLCKCCKDPPQQDVWGCPEGTHQVLWY